MADNKSMPIETKTGRPEDELLLLCARVSRHSEEADRISALLQQGEIDWEYLFTMAGEHRMMPLLYWHLGATASAAVPKTVLGRLRDYFHYNNLRNLSLTGELLKLLRVFDAHGVPTVPYKGPTLAALAYGNLALREFNDLDILVHEQDIPRARRLLVSMGYRQEDRLARAQEAAFLKSQREYVFVCDGSGSVVELHWAIMPRIYSFPLDPERLWERLEQTSLGGSTVPTFSPEDLLLILCVHGSKHFWHRLAWICDVAELIRVHKTIDWEQLIDRASTLGSERMLFLGLFLANDLLGAALPKTVSHKTQADPAVRVLAEQVKEWLFQEVKGFTGTLAEDPFNESGFHPFRVKMRERLRDKIRYCAHTALVPTIEDWKFLPLPGLLSPLYYVLRPIRLAGRYGPRVLKQVFR